MKIKPSKSDNPEYRKSIWPENKIVNPGRTLRGKK